MLKKPDIDVKICGLKTREAVEAALDGGASHIGFIFFKKSPRNIGVKRAAILREIARGRALVVAVSVNADNDTLDKIVETVQPDILQLHGNETVERVSEIRERYSLSVMKAIAIRKVGDLDGATAYENVVDCFLFDAKPPTGSELPGGNGVSFDWELLNSFKSDIPIVLSGGLDRQNVIEAMSIAHPEGIDISSGVETSPGVKDVELIAGFMRQVTDMSG